MKIVFIGPQGSGKGTQAKILSERLGFCHISTGDLLRGSGGELKKKVDEIMNKGGLISDDLMLDILKKRISCEDCLKGFILDGFPRTLNQAKLLEGVVKIDKVVEIFISDDNAVKRIFGRVSCSKCGEGYNNFTELKPKVEGKCDKCGSGLVRRDDDNEYAVRKRLKIYHKETEPVLEFYGSEIVKVDGMQGVEKIYDEIVEELEGMEFE